MDEKKLLKYAVDYLSKYDSSKNNLVSVLKRKILRLKKEPYKNRLSTSDDLAITFLKPLRFMWIW